MFNQIQPFINLLLFRAGPQDMPASQGILKIVIGACFITDIIGAASVLGLSLASVLSAGQIVLYSGFIYLLLKMAQKPERLVQTLTALFGALALINLASYPFMRNLHFFSEGKLQLTPTIVLVALLQLWFFIVMARILREALEISTGRAALLTFLIIQLVPILLSSVIGMLGITPPAIAIDPGAING